MNRDNIYDFTVIDIDGNVVPMSKFTNEVLLIVNTASKNEGKRKLKKLQKLYEEFHTKGLEIIAFPCSQFVNQESKETPSIKYAYRQKLHCTFPVMARVSVNGPNEHPMFRWLKKKAPGPVGKDITWNFCSFLITSNGTVRRRMGSECPYSKLKRYITSELELLQTRRMHRTNPEPIRKQDLLPTYEPPEKEELVTEDERDIMKSRRIGLSINKQIHDDCDRRHGKLP